MASLPFGFPARGGNANQTLFPQQQVAAASSSRSNPDDDALIDALEQVLSAAENRKIQASSPAACREGAAPIQGSSGGPLNAQELSILTLLCTKIENDKKTNSNTPGAPIGFGAVDGDLLSTLTEFLEKHVNQAVGVDLIQEAIAVIHKHQKVDQVRNVSHEQKYDINLYNREFIRSSSILFCSPSQWIRNGGIGHDRIAALRMGLEAASILLFIVTSPGVEMRVVSEDAIEATFTLLRHHLSKNVIPALNNSGHLLAAQIAEEEKGITSPRSKRRKRSSGGGEGNNAVARELKKIYKYIVSMMDLHLQLMERVEVAVQDLFVDDQHIITVTSGAMAALEIEALVSSQSPAHRLQLATIGLVTAVFRKFPMHRSSIIEDMFPLMLKVPMHKRTMRTFPVPYASCPSPQSTQTLNTTLFSEMLTNGNPPTYIQMMTALLLSLIQSTVARPTFAAPKTTNHHNNNNEGGDAEGDNGADEAEEEEGPRMQFVSGLRGCQAIADMFAVQLLQRCSRKGEDGGASEFRPILVNLVEDLLLVIMVPEFPAAQMVLLSFANVLSRDLVKTSQVSSTNSDKVVESTYINTAFDTLGRICSAYAKILAAQRQREFRTTAVAVPDERKYVRCYCKRNEWTDTLMVSLYCYIF